jgi:hypothetical protein
MPGNRAPIELDRSGPTPAGFLKSREYLNRRGTYKFFSPSGCLAGGCLAGGCLAGGGIAQQQQTTYTGAHG